MSKIFFSAIALAALFAGVAEAGVSPYCKITEVDASATGNTYVYCTQNATTMPQAIVYYCYTPSEKLIPVAAAAAANGKTVRLWAGTFPTTGTYRAGGACTYIEIFPNY